MKECCYFFGTFGVAHCSSLSMFIQLAVNLTALVVAAARLAHLARCKYLSGAAVRSIK